MGGKKKAGGTKKKPAAKKVQQATTKGKESNTLTANKTVSKEKVKRKLGSDPVTSPTAEDGAPKRRRLDQDAEEQAEWDEDNYP